MTYFAKEFSIMKHKVQLLISWLATSSFAVVTKTYKEKKNPEYVVTQLFYVIRSDWLNTSNRIQYVSASCRK